MNEEAERSARLSGSSGRGLLGRVQMLDASRGDLADLIHYGGSPSAAVERRGQGNSQDDEPATVASPADPAGASPPPARGVPRGVTGTNGPGAGR